MFQPVYRYPKKISNSIHISVLKSKGLSDESIKRPATSENNLALSLYYKCGEPRIKFEAVY